MRHTCVSLLSDAGVSPERIADLLGHTSPRMVLSVYRHAVGPTVDTAATVLDGVLANPGPTRLVREDSSNEESPSGEGL
jgi:integrase